MLEEVQILIGREFRRDVVVILEIRERRIVFVIEKTRRIRDQIFILDLDYIRIVLFFTFKL